MRRFTLVLGAAATAAAAAAALGAGPGQADPGDANSTLNVVGEPYAKAVAILRAQGVPAVFGGAVGDGLPQAQCIVSSQKVLSTRKISLMLNCDSAAAPQQSPGAPSSATATSGAQSSAAARPTPGAPGVVTVTPTRVG